MTNTDYLANLTTAYVRLWGAYQTLSVNFSERTAVLERRIAELTRCTTVRERKTR